MIQMMEYSLFNLQRFKIGISAAMAVKEISNPVTVRTIKCWDALPGEATESLSLEVFKKSLEKHLLRIIQSSPYLEAGQILEVHSSPVFCDSASFQKQCRIFCDF